VCLVDVGRQERVEVARDARPLAVHGLIHPVFGGIDERGGGPPDGREQSAGRIVGGGEVPGPERHDTRVRARELVVFEGLHAGLVGGVGRSADATVEALRRLVEEHFRNERLIGFYAEKLAITPDRLNDHVKRVSGVTAGHLIRQRVLTEAKRALVFTGQPIHEVSYDLGFADPSHFARFFRKQTGTTPQEFREGRGG